MNKQEIKKLLIIENPTIIEIGSNDGKDTKEFLDVFKKIIIYCFEPDLRAILKFKKTIKDERCKLFECAISNKDGVTTFYMSGGSKDDGEDWDLSSSIKKPYKHLSNFPWCTFNKKVIIPTIKLDTWAEDNKIKEIDFIWADVQGAERELIEGGIETLNEKTKFFYTEFSNEELYENQIGINKILKLLPNFKIINKYGNNILLSNKNLTNIKLSPKKVLEIFFYRIIYPLQKFKHYLLGKQLYFILNKITERLLPKYSKEKEK